MTYQRKDAAARTVNQKREERRKRDKKIASLLGQADAARRLAERLTVRYPYHWVGDIMTGERVCDNCGLPLIARDPSRKGEVVGIKGHTARECLGPMGRASAEGA